MTSSLGPHPDNPVVVAAWKALHEIHTETGGGDAFNPNRSPEYLAAQRVWVAVLEAHREIIHQRTNMRHGKRPLAIVKGPEDIDINKEAFTDFNAVR